MKTRTVSLAAMFAVAFALTAHSTPFTRNSPAGGPLPAGVTEVGGVVADLVGANGVRIVSQLPASALYQGFSHSGSPVAYQGNPLTIGIQSGFTPAILGSLGGGLVAIAVRISLYDGDTGPGDFDEGENTLLINGVNAGNFSDIVTQETTPDGLTEISMNPSGGFRDESLDTGFFLVNGPVELAAIFAALLGTGQLVIQVNDVDPTDNYYEFTAGVDGGLIDVGTGPTPVTPLVKAALKKVRRLKIVDAGAIASATESALPTAISHRSAMLGFSRVAARDLNARLFRERSASQADREAAGADLERDLVDRISVYAAADYSTSDTEPKGLGLGFDAETWSASGGAELALDARVKLGLAATVFRGEGDLDREIASIETTGVMLSPYVVLFEQAGYLDVLYSIGTFTSDLDRPTGQSMASGDTDTLLHAVEINAGWNFEAQGLVFGPIAGFDYRHLSIDGYRESAVWGAVSYDDQTVESAISRLGGQISWPTKVSGVKVVPQIRAAWEHEYLDDVKDITVGLLRSPVTIIEGGTIRSGDPFSTTLRSATLEEDYLSAGAGVRVELGRGVSVLLDYEGHFFRGDSTLHMAAAKVLVDL